jgi:uncharacterized protein YcfJ
MRLAHLLGLGGLISLTACTAVPPPGPTVLALPPQGKDFATFQREDAYCQQVASQQSGLPNAPQAAGNAVVGSAALGALGGAALGAAIGAVSGNAGAGAAIGAGSGLVGGGLVGASNAQLSTAELQQRFNIVYAQCMTAYGNQLRTPVAQPVALAPAVPVYGGPAITLGYGYGYAGRPYGWGRPWYGYGNGWGWRRGYW